MEVLWERILRKGVKRFLLFVVVVCFNYLIFYDLFIFGCTGSLLLCTGFLWLWITGAALWLWCGSGFSCCRARALGCSGLVVVHWLRCLATCEISLDQRSNLCPLHQQVFSYPLGYQGSPVLFCFK